MILATSRVRHRLLERINEPCLAPVTLVTAPAGYGKSTFVAQWARATDHQVAWVSLGSESNTPACFRAQLATAIEQAVPDRDIPVADDGSLDAIVQALDSVVQSGQQPVLVLDDYHQIENQDIHEAMDGLIRRLPDRVHLVLISRTLPPLSLGRLQVEGSVRHLTEEALRFTPEETAAVVGDEAPDRLTEDQIATLGRRTEGWIAGIRLALASLDRVDPAAVQSLVDTWPVHQWLDDYIVGEVLAGLPEDVRAFVLRTANLPELTPALCDAVLGLETSARLIEEMRRRLVFIRVSDGIGAAVSYHPLFAESVGRIADRQWPASDRQERHRRAARWYEAQGQLEAAVDQAVAAGDWETAERCVRPLGRALTDSGLRDSRLHLLSKLPEARVLADPELAWWYISALQNSGRHHDAWQAFAAAEPMWQASGDPAHLGHVASGRWFFALLNEEYDRALQPAEAALEHYPPEYAVDRLHAWTIVNEIAYHQADDDRSALAHREAERCRERLPAEQGWWTEYLMSTPANQQALRWNLPAAHAMSRAALGELSSTYYRSAAKIQVRLAAIALEWNDLDGAACQAARSERVYAQVQQHIWHADVLVVLARVYEALGDAEKLAWTVSRLSELHQRYGGRRVQSRLEAVQVPAWLATGREGLARAWAARAQRVKQPLIDTFGDVDVRLMVARVRIADGQHARADELLRACIDESRTFKRWAEIVAQCVWHAVACVGLGDDAGALASLRLALQHGMPGGFVRSFLTPGYDLLPFLDRVRHELPADEAAYAQGVLGGEPAVGPVPVMDAVPEPGRELARQSLDSPLSVRERDVLALLRAGCTNQEIADRLFISERTVRKHVGSILKKMDVPNRTAAVFRAQELGML